MPEDRIVDVVPRGPATGVKLRSRFSARTRSPRVLYVYSVDASFVRTDLAILSSISKVEPVQFRGKSSYPAIARGILRADIVVCWFALGFALFSSLVGGIMGRRSVVISGGWDVEAIPEIGYGLLQTRWGRVRARAALTAADVVLAFSEYSAGLIRSVAPKAKVKTGPLGVDTESFRPGKKDGSVVTIAHINRENLDRKGLRSFVLAARNIPNVRAIVVGKQLDDAVDELRRISGPNVSFPGWLPTDELQAVLAKASVYAQPSYTEGFGLAIAEAMASGCVPVVTRAGAIPELVGDTGIYVRYGDIRELSNAIQRAIDSPVGPLARERVKTFFSLNRRSDLLKRTVNELER